MGSSIATLNELTVIAIDDYLLVHDTSDLLDQDKRISQTNLMASYSVRSGTPTAGRVASWITPTSIGDSGIAVTQLAQKTGAPVANNLASWNDANTLKDGGVAVANLPQKSGTLVAGNNAHWSNTTGTLVDSGFPAADIIRKSGTQTLTILSPGILQVGDAAGVDTISAASATGGISVNRFAANNSSPPVIFRKSRSPTIGGHAIVANGDLLGQLLFVGSNGASYEAAAQILVRVDGAPGVGDMPGRIEFQTSVDGSAAPTTVLTLGANNLATFAGGINLGQGTLNYFDFGAWPILPFISGSVSNPTCTYSIQDSFFMRIGATVFFSFLVVINTISGGSGNVQVAQLPFVASAAQQPRCNVVVDGIAIPGTAPFMVSLSAISSTTTFRLIAMQNNATFANIPVANFGPGDSIAGSGFYFI